MGKLIIIGLKVVAYRQRGKEIFSYQLDLVSISVLQTSCLMFSTQ